MATDTIGSADVVSSTEVWEAPTKTRPPLFTSQVCDDNGKEGRLTLLVRLGRPEFSGPVGPEGIRLSTGRVAAI